MTISICPFVAARTAVKHLTSERIKMNDSISRQAAIDALWKALFEYEDKTEKQFIESDKLDVEDWIQHRNFVQNMNDIDRQTILNLPSAQPERKKGTWKHGYCSECGYDWGKDAPLASVPNFCPACGVEMSNE